MSQVLTVGKISEHPRVLLYTNNISSRIAWSTLSGSADVRC